jgi:hypothetical protein
MGGAGGGVAGACRRGGTGAELVGKRADGRERFGFQAVENLLRLAPRFDDPRALRAPLLAVQWHPEWAADGNDQSQTYFHLLGRALRGEL